MNPKKPLQNSILKIFISSDNNLIKMIIKEAKKIEIKINANPMNLDGIKRKIILVNFQLRLKRLQLYFYL